MVVNTIIQHLISLGFSDYEAKTYTALVENNPATAYETARTAGISTSKIYQVINKLARRGMVQEIQEDGKKRYIPLDPEEFIKGHTSAIISTMKTLEEDFSRLQQKNEVSYVWNITRYNDLMDKTERMIDETGKSLLISIWREEYNMIRPMVADAVQRGIRLAVVHFGIPDIEAPYCFQHPIEETIYSEGGGRGITLVTDSREALMGTVHEDGTVDGAWSGARGFINLAEDYIKHDIYLMKIVQRFDSELIDTFGEGYSLLRDVFSNNIVQ